MPRPVRWSELTWPQIESLLVAQPDEVGLLPVGATEQHGPHLPTGTDTILATAISEAVSERTGAPVLPALAVGCSYGHGTVLPGTLSLTPEQLADTVRQVVEWAAISGLRKVLLVNGHLGNQSALGVGTDHLRLCRTDLRVGVTSWWSAAEAVAAEVFSDGEDVHANRAETSLMLAVAPHLVSLEMLDGSDDPDRTGGLVFRYTAPELSTNGVTGRPSEANVEFGRRLFEVAVEAVADMVMRGRAEVPPLVPAPETAPERAAAARHVQLTGVRSPAPRAARLQ
jgi:creatinine amidohydrolase